MQVQTFVLARQRQVQTFVLARQRQVQTFVLARQRRGKHLCCVNHKQCSQC
jgi:hypothetical protein